MTTPAIPKTRKKLNGPPVPANWKADYIARVRAHGLYYRAAEEAGVNYDTALVHRRQDPAFDTAVEQARQANTDDLTLALKATSDAKSNGDPGNPVGLIVLLKSRRPAEFIERTATLSATVDVNALDPNAGLAVVEAILGEMRPAARARLRALQQAALTSGQPENLQSEHDVTPQEHERK